MIRVSELEQTTREQATHEQATHEQATYEPATPEGAADGESMEYNILDQINQVEQEAAAVGFCLGSGLFGSYNSD